MKDATRHEWGYRIHRTLKRQCQVKPLAKVNAPAGYPGSLREQRDGSSGQH